MSSRAGEEGEEDGLGGQSPRLVKRVSLEGPMILRLAQEGRAEEAACDHGGEMDMDWEAGPGYYARAADDKDWCHQYRDQNQLLRALAEERMRARFSGDNG